MRCTVAVLSKAVAYAVYWGSGSKINNAVEVDSRTRRYCIRRASISSLSESRMRLQIQACQDEYNLPPILDVGEAALRSPWARGEPEQYALV